MKIVVLAGGTSTERDVSIVSGTGICGALRQKGHQAILVDVFCGQEEVDWEDPFPAEYDVEKAAEYMSSFNPQIKEMEKKRRSFFGPNVLELCEKCDIVFLGLHGANGEDGKVQAAFDLMGIRYTGTGPLGAAVSMDKALSKQLFREGGVPTPYGISLKKGQLLPQDVSYPAVVKACNGGSSVGVYMVNDRAECEKALAQAYAYDDAVIIEQYIKGREFSVGVIEGKALPIIEIAPIEGFYDYKNKYQAGSTVETCPAVLDEALTKEMQHYAELAYEVLHITSYARMDFMMNEKNEMFCLEANTLPGMTPTSLLPQEAAVMGYNFNQLCEWLIEVSLRK